MTRTQYLIYALLTLSAISLSACGSGSRLTSDKQVKVYVNFTVDENGVPQDVKVVKLVCQDCPEEEEKLLEAEAIRLVKELPQQGPGFNLKPGLSYTLPMNVVKRKPESSNTSTSP